MSFGRWAVYLDNQTMEVTVLTKQQQIVQTYTEGFAAGDPAQIVSYVSDDIVWEFNWAITGQNIHGAHLPAPRVHLGYTPTPHPRPGSWASG